MAHTSQRLKPMGAGSGDGEDVERKEADQRVTGSPISESVGHASHLTLFKSDSNGTSVVPGNDRPLVYIRNRAF